MSRDAAVVALAEAIDLGDLGTRIAPKALDHLEANGWSLAPAASEIDLTSRDATDVMVEIERICHSGKGALRSARPPRRPRPTGPPDVSLVS